jgi:tetratricopeptide (TPR) repeat protein
VVIGGTSIRGGSGSVWGAFVGALLIGIVANLFNLLGVGPAWQQVAKGAIIILAVLLQAISDRQLAWSGLSFAAPSLRGLGGWAKGIAVFAVLVLAVNGALVGAAPSLFEIDLAKAPYTRANNYELTRVYRRAIPLYQEVIERFPDSEYALLSRIGIANSARGMGDLAFARESYAALLVDVTEATIPENLRFDILKNYAALLQELGDAQSFEAVYEQLALHYPDADATREAKIYLDQLHASTAGAGAIPEDAPVVVAADAVSLPASVHVGERFDLVISVAPNGDDATDFSLMTPLNFWKGFKFVKAAPNPRSVSDFWGRRAWSFGKLKEPMTLTVTLEAIAAGDYDLDLDVEQSFNVLEYGIVKPITVEE